jgi:hypothetical protein
MPASADVDGSEAFSEYGLNSAKLPFKHPDFDRSQPHFNVGTRHSQENGAGAHGMDSGGMVGRSGPGMMWLPWAAYPVPDVNGDSKTDVLVNTVQYSEDGGIKQRVIAKIGENGTHLWEESITSTEVGESVWMEAHGVLDWDWNWYWGGVYSDWYEYWYGYCGYRNMDMYSWDWSWYWDWYWNWDGGESGDWYKYSKYVPEMSDMNGDGKADVLVMTYEGYWWGEKTNVTLIAKDGTNGNHLWEEPINSTGDDVWLDYALAYAVPDMNSDDNTDVLVTIYEHNETTESYNVTLIAKNGTDGSHLWEEPINSTGDDVRLDYALAYAVPDLNGDGNTDVLVTIYEYNTSTERDNVTLIAKDGTNGYHLWEETISGDDVWVVADGVPDMNGDDNTDVLVTIYWYDGTGDYVTLIAKNGTNGNHLWEEIISGDDLYVNAYAVPDLNGDGNTDVFVTIYEYYGFITLIAKNGTDGSHLWEESFTSKDLIWAQGGVVPDLDGDDKPDVLVSTFEYNESADHTISTVIAKIGKNGTHLWEESISSTRTAIGTGGVAFEPDAGWFCEGVTAMNASELPPEAAPLPPLEFPYGFFRCKICGLENGTTVNVTITLPKPVPVSTQYWKYSPDGNGSPTEQPGWYQVPLGSNDGDNVITITLQDGGIGDADGVVNGRIVDPGGPGNPRAKVPALTPLGIAALVGLLAIIATSTILRRKR